MVRGQSVRLYRARWLVSCQEFQPAADLAGPVADGGVATIAGTIAAAGRFSDLRRQYPAAPVLEYPDAILTPALVNCHTHLELSHLAGLGREDIAALGLAGWIRELLERRRAAEETDPRSVEARRAAVAALEELRRRGTGLVLDIGNQAPAGPMPDGVPRVIFLLEMLGLSGEAERAALRRLEKLSAPDSGPVRCTAHAPYSTGPGLLQRLKQAAGGRPFSIHTAESIAENEFLTTGSGPFRELTAERGMWDDSYRPPGCGAVEYLDRLGLLDPATVCVHAVQVTQAEIELLAARGAGVCLCPGSNLHLAVGRPPVPAMLAAGILPGLGTDSLASNQALNIWREMRLLRRMHPELEPAAVFAMATAGGARTLGLEKEYGRLAPDARAMILAVGPAGGGEGPRSAARVYEYLTAEEPPVSWVQAG